MVEIIPALLEKNEEDYREMIGKLNQSPELEEGWVHIDFVDGIFAENSTIKPEVVQKYPTNLNLEAHLMVMDPLDWLDKIIEVGFKRVILHVESNDYQKCIEYLKAKNIEVGISLKMTSSLEEVEEILGKIDLVVVMSVEPGFQGQPFLDDSIERIKVIENLRKDKGLSFKIGVDGAVSNKNAKLLMEAGCDNLIIGSYLVKGDISENLEKIWEEINT